MIVAIDTLSLSKRHSNTGSYAYLRNTLKGCLRFAETTTPGIKFHGFVDPNDNWATNGFASPFLSVHETRILSRTRLWCLGGMALSTSVVRPDVVFLPTAHTSIPGPFAPVVTTILDAMPRLLPSDLVAKGKLLHWMTWVNAKLASKIITISSWSKRDLVEFYGLDPETVEVIYLGYDKGLYNDAPPDAKNSAALLTRLGIRRPFVLHHGTVQLRKNPVRLIQAWDLMVGHRKCPDTRLVLAGALGRGHEEILRVRQASPNREHTILTGALRDVELAALVKNASLCVIPSLYEGFCLPMVEAMACGVPTIASNSSCIPEVSGGVLEYFDPLSVEEMAQAIGRALEDSDLRERLRRGGLARAAEFSWERCARETLRVLESAAEHGPKHPIASRS